jgi:hypothetical protein
VLYFKRHAIMHPLVLIPLMTCLVNLGLSIVLRDTPYLPIEMSKIANNVPQYYILLGGLSLSALYVIDLPSPTYPALPWICGSLLSTLALFSDRNHWWIHAPSAFGFFVASLFYLYTIGGLHAGLLACIAISIVSRLVINAAMFFIGERIYLLRIRALSQYANILFLLYAMSLSQPTLTSR